MIGLATSWSAVLAIRFTDRIGKGIRTTPRDALIADVTHPGHRGAAYGFHRAMDHAGAVLGPLVAAALMAGLGLSMRAVFLCAIVPGLFVIVLIMTGVREKKAEAPGSRALHLRGAWAGFPRELKIVFAAVFLFTLGNATDAFLLLRLSDLGLPAPWVAALWSLHHVVKMAASYAGGALSDRTGRRFMILSGWALYTLVYVAFALTTSLHAAIVIFMMYGVYYGLVEPSEKAWIADLAPMHARATAMGYYQASIGLGALPASLAFGFLWSAFGASFAFFAGAALAACACGVLMLARNPRFE
jgi:MFS family permease